jgi:hypothetical protein
MNISPTAITHMTRNNHLIHMTRVLPLLAIIFMAQCFFIPQAFPELQLGNLYFVMSVALCCGVMALYLYDTQIQIFIKDQNLHWQIPIFKIKKTYSLLELNTIDVFDPEQPFSNLKLSFGKNKKILNLYFIDNPEKVIKVLWQSKVDALNAQMIQKDESDHKAA